MEYEYERTLEGTLKLYDIGWIEYDVQTEDNLCDEINTSISKLPTMVCDGIVCTIIHDEALSAPDEASQDAVVAAHKAAAPEG